MELDARAAASASNLTADVCIVGAGPAGLALAHALVGAGREVVLLESGSLTAPSETEGLNLAEHLGNAGLDPVATRCRRIGGTAALWNTFIEGRPFAKYLPLDPIDFTQREWLPWSGWPFGRPVLEPYYARAHELCGLGAFDYDLASRRPPPAPLDLGGTRLENGIYQHGPADRFTDQLPTALLSDSRAMVVHGATVTRLEHRDGRVAALRWQTLAGPSGTVRAERTVLAAGTIENSRLLLLAGLGGEWVGRGFMEHPIDQSLELLTRASELVPLPGFYARHPGPLVPELGRISLTEELMRGERLWNASLRLVIPAEPELLHAPAARAAARRLLPSLRLRRLAGRWIRGAAEMIRQKAGMPYEVWIDLEQAPHPENRVLLSDRLDSLGLRQAEVRWRFQPEDAANLERVRKALSRELGRAGIGQVRLRTQRRLDPNAHHHAGTTRMHEDPDHGVVDANLRVHRSENLFVSGASVFPTAGFANPTLTVVALSLRLADYLVGVGE